MLIFWIVIAVMVLVALAFVVPPLLWPRPLFAPDAVSLSVALYKERLQRLEQQKQAGEIAPDEYSSLRLELEKSLLGEIPEVKANPVLQKPGTGLAVALLIIVPLVAVVFYWYSGSWRQLADYKATAEKTRVLNAEIAKLGSLDNIIAQLKQRVQEHPDGHGWFLLGRLYMKDGHFPEAIAAFARADQLTPATPEILVAYAEALYFANGRSLNPQAMALLTTTLKLQPDQPEAVNMLAVDAYQRGNYSQAAGLWERLLPQYPPDSDEGKVLLRMIGEAQQHTGKPSVAAKILLPVSVQLAASLKNKVQGDETLFIYAQALAGPPMPLAVVRRLARDLPLEITLNEQMGMMPGMSLTDFKQVRIIARISKSGQPLAASGDLEGSSGVVEVRQHPEKIVVVINRVN
jgi:cytochrome c-type biogenesis protein CcmH